MKKNQVFRQTPADLLPKISVKMVTIDIKINLCSIDMHVAQKKSLHLLLKFIEFSCLSKSLFYISSFNHVSLELCSYLYSYRTDPMTRYLKRVAVDSYFYEEK